MTENSLWKQYWKNPISTWDKFPCPLDSNNFLNNNMVIRKLNFALDLWFCTHYGTPLLSKAGNYSCGEVLMGIKSRLINSLWIPASDRYQTILNTYSLSGQIWKILINVSINGNWKLIFLQKERLYKEPGGILRQSLIHWWPIIFSAITGLSLIKYKNSRPIITRLWSKNRSQNVW